VQYLATVVFAPQGGSGLVGRLHERH